MSKFRVTKVVVGGSSSKPDEPRIDAIETPFPRPYMDHSFRMMIIGPSGRGKSNLFVNMLTKPQVYGYNKQFHDSVFDNIYLFCPTYNTDQTLNILTTQGVNGDTYLDYDESIFAVADKEVITEIVKEKIGEIEDKLKTLEPGEIPPKTLMVFDDLTNELNSSTIIRNLFTKGRKHQISIIIMTNQYKRYVPEIRNNVTNFALFAPTTSQETTDIFKDIGYNVKHMEALAKQVFENKKCFILVDRTKPEQDAVYYSDANGELHKY